MVLHSGAVKKIKTAISAELSLKTNKSAETPKTGRDESVTAASAEPTATNIKSSAGASEIKMKLLHQVKNSGNLPVTVPQKSLSRKPTVGRAAAV